MAYYNRITTGVVINAPITNEASPTLCAGYPGISAGCHWVPLIHLCLISMSNFPILTETFHIVSIDTFDKHQERSGKASFTLEEVSAIEGYFNWCLFFYLLLNVATWQFSCWVTKIQHNLSSNLVNCQNLLYFFVRPEHFNTENLKTGSQSPWNLYHRESGISRLRLRIVSSSKCV